MILKIWLVQHLNLTTNGSGMEMEAYMSLYIYIYIIYINILQYIIYIQVHAPNSAKGVDFCRMAKVKHDV